MKSVPRKGSRAELQKRNALLQAIHRSGSASRLQLSKTLSISNSRVCDLVEQMIDEGLLKEEAALADRRGRRGVAVQLNPQAGHWIGFDMEAKRLRMVVTDFAGEVVWSRLKPLENVTGGPDFLQRVLGFFDESMPEIRTQYGRLLGIGLAASGVTDIQRGVIRRYHPLPDVVDLPLRDAVAKQTGLPCVMENNIRAMTLAEWTSGAARGLSTFACVAVRSGVGAGVVIHDKLHEGSHGLAGEIGYMVLPTDGPADTWRTLQQTVSESSLSVDMELRPESVSPVVASRVGAIVGSQLASLAVVIDPEAIVLAGPMLMPDTLVWRAAVETFQTAALTEIAARVRLLPAALGPFAAARGAAYRCLYEIAVTPSTR